MRQCLMRILLPILALLGLSIAGCSPVTLPRLLPARAEPQAAPVPAEEDICRAWRRALDGYDAAGERRRLADMLRARGEDPARCEDAVGGKQPVPLSPGVAAPRSMTSTATPERPSLSRQKKKRSTSRRIDAPLTCSSELVKGPPDRYKTVCR